MNKLLLAVIIIVVVTVSYSLYWYNYNMVLGQTPALEKAKLLQYYEEMQLNEKILAVDAQCKNLPLNSSIEDLILCVEFIQKYAEELKPKQYIP